MGEGDRKEQTVRFGKEGQASVETAGEDIPPFPNPKQRMVRILWERPGKGSSFEGGETWTSISSSHYRTPLLVDTVGILLQENDTAYLVTQSIDEKGKNKGRTVIGKDTVKGIYCLDRAAETAPA